MDQFNYLNGTEGGVPGNLHLDIYKTFVANRTQQIDLNVTDITPFSSVQLISSEEALIPLSRHNHSQLVAATPRPASCRLSSPSGAQ
jgi:hypothetical protein